MDCMEADLEPAIVSIIGRWSSKGRFAHRSLITIHIVATYYVPIGNVMDEHYRSLLCISAMLVLAGLENKNDHKSYILPRSHHYRRHPSHLLCMLMSCTACCAHGLLCLTAAMLLLWLTAAVPLCRSSLEVPNEFVEFIFGKDHGKCQQQYDLVVANMGNNSLVVSASCFLVVH